MKTSTSELEAALAAFDELVMDGHPPDTATFCAQYPHLSALPHHLGILRALREQADVLGTRAALPPNRKLGAFTLVRLLGSGGMGQVYLAWQDAPRRLCAVKTLKLADTHSVERFRREAAITAKLEHQHIASVYGAGQDDGYAYLALQLIYGSSLRAVLQNADAGSTEPAWLSEVLTAIAERPVANQGCSVCIPPRIATEIAMQTAEALAHAHAAGVVHRDIKPTNLMVSVSGQIKVIDFGIAIAWAQDEGHLTATGGFVGSFDYAAPEQLQGDRAAIGPWSDTYALGATLYEMLTQRLPYPGASFADRLLQVHAPLAVGPRQLEAATPRALDLIVRKALAVDPKERFQDGAEFAEALAEVGRAAPVRRATGGHTGRQLHLLGAVRGYLHHLFWLALCGALFTWGLQQKAGRVEATYRLGRTEAVRDRAIAKAVIEQHQAALKQCIISTKEPGKFVPAVLPPLFEATATIYFEKVQSLRVSSFSRNLPTKTKACMVKVLTDAKFVGIGLGETHDVELRITFPLETKP